MKISHLLIAVLLFVACTPEPRFEDSIEPCTDAELAPDGLRVFLLTMPPNDEVFSIFGHNAIWISDARSGNEIVYNYGYIPTDQGFLLWRFLDGTMNARLSTRTPEKMRAYYTKTGRSIYAQRLALNAPAARRLWKLLQTAALKENRDYRYDWRTMSCTTQLRDLLDKVTNGQLKAHNQGMMGLSYRDETIRHVAGNLPVWFGWSSAAGPGADRELSVWEGMFLPDRLFQGVARVQLEEVNGATYPLVSRTCELQRGEFGWPPAQQPERRGIAGVIGMLLAIGLVFLGLRAQRARWARWGLGASLVGIGLVCGFLGLLNLALINRSLYVGVLGTPNVFFVHPGSLVLLLVGYWIARGRALPKWAEWASLILSGLAGMGGLLFALGVFPAGQAVIVGLYLAPLLAVGAAVRMWRASSTTEA